jgi:hypothetical protein
VILAAVWLVSGLHAVQTLRHLPRLTDRPFAEPGWVIRYQEAATTLRAEPVAWFLSDPREEGQRFRLYRAQFALAPTVLVRTPPFDRFRPSTLRRGPLLMDYSSKESLDRDLSTLRRRATAQGSEISVLRLTAQLAVVRLARTRP